MVLQYIYQIKRWFSSLFIKHKECKDGFQCIYKIKRWFSSKFIKYKEKLHITYYKEYKDGSPVYLPNIKNIKMVL